MTLDTERIHRWLTQAELDQMLDRARNEGFSDACDAIANMVELHKIGWTTVDDIAKAARSLRDSGKLP